MPKQILILDDDVDFNNLLKDVFSQADYKVLTAESIEEAESTLSKNEVDLIVTDHRLPLGSGLEFVKSLRRAKVAIPVIMVSGFLDNETIRELIREGINGIFIKPLNIFSLLKKASDLIETYELRRSSQTSVKKGQGEDPSERLSSLPCVSAKGREFYNRAIDYSGFQHNLLLIGPEGMPYEGICTELIKEGALNDRAIFVQGDQVSYELLEKRLAECAGSEVITLVILKAEELSEESSELIMNIECPPDGPSIRFIFCFSSTIEDLYDAEKINEDFYLFLGSNELHIPSLSEMPEDLIVLSEQEMRNLDESWILDTKVKTLILRHDWPGNLTELKKVFSNAFKHAGNREPQTEHFEKAIRDSALRRKQSESSQSMDFQRFLHEERKRYESAMRRLLAQ